MTMCADCDLCSVVLLAGRETQTRLKSKYICCITFVSRFYVVITVGALYNITTKDGI